MPRLCYAALAQAHAAVARPRYDRSALSTGIVHLGLGAFARAHLLAYTEDAIERGGAGALAWGIAGVNLRSGEQRERLIPQDCLYGLLSRGPAGDRARIVGCLTDVLAGTSSLGNILGLMAAPATRIVSMTVTEKGYCHDPASGRLKLDHPDIAHDLANPETPRSAVGVVAAALDRRRAAGLPPFTVLCCDNLAGNGAIVRGLVTDFVAHRDDALAGWIAAHGAFPSTMVDRIVPAMTPDDIVAAARVTGLSDAAPVVHEPFAQWVIEDRFVDDARPAWHDVGAELVGDVAPFEAMKLKMLNAAHSALAYLGYLAGHETIGDCVGDSVLRTYVAGLWAEEIIPVLARPPGADLASYARALLDRFANPAIRHRTWQIAMDGSQKLPPRLLETIAVRLQRGLPIDRLALAVAAWMIYVGGRHLTGTPIDVRDPLAASLQARLAVAGEDPRRRIEALLGETAIFSRELADQDRFVSALVDAYQAIVRLGSRDAVEAMSVR